MNKHVQKSPFLLQASLAVMLVQSFVISTVIKGLVPSYLLILLLFIKDLTLNITQKITLRVLFSLLKFAAVFIAIQIIVQFINSLTNPVFGGLITISFEPSHISIFRRSLFTQSIYLFTCLILFLYLLNYMKEVGPERLLKIARVGVIIFVLYGFFEFFGYLLTGQNLDIFSNRVTGDGSTIGHFQVVQLGGLQIQRMKSLAGEPSMFAYSILPFIILFYYLKDRIYILLLIALVLSTATTGVVGLLFFILVEILFFRKSMKIVYTLAGLLAVMSIFLYDVVSEFIGFTYDKFSLINMSSIDRFAKFTDHLRYFLDSDIFHILFGYGFGYFRSTDGITTLLLNIGLLGTAAFSAFILYPLIKIKINSDYRRGLAASLMVILPVMFISVAEFFYIQIWFFAALAWFEYYKDYGANNDSR